MRKLVMVFWVLTMLMLAACGGTASPTATPGDGGATTGGGDAAASGPADAVRTFMEVTYAGDNETVASLYCSAIDTSSIPAGATLTEGATYDLSGLTYEVVSEDGDQAQVRVSGPITFSVDVAGTTTSSTVDMPETTYPMRNEDGWKICPA